MHSRATRRYAVVYTQDREGWWLAEIPSVQGYHTQGRTLVQARRRIREALSVCLPNPRTAAGATLTEEVYSQERVRRMGAHTRTRCDWCKSPLVQVIEPRRLARGDEFVIVDQTWLACPKACPEYDGEPFTVSNSWEENERRAQAAWVEKYGHPLSYSGAANVEEGRGHLGHWSLARPTVAIVEGIRVMVHYNAAAPPHVHLSKGDTDIVVPIDAPTLPSWAFSPEERQAILAWIEERNSALHAAWKRAGSGQNHRSTP